MKLITFQTCLKICDDINENLTHRNFHTTITIKQLTLEIIGDKLRTLRSLMLRSELILNKEIYNLLTNMIHATNDINIQRAYFTNNIEKIAEFLFNEGD